MFLQIHEPGQTPLPHEGHRGGAVGIDLGTTNTVVAVSEGGAASVLRDDHGRGLIPSVVYLRARRHGRRGRGRAPRAARPSRRGGLVDQAADGPRRRRGQGAGRLAALSGRRLPGRHGASGHRRPHALAGRDFRRHPARRQSPRRSLCSITRSPARWSRCRPISTMRRARRRATRRAWRSSKCCAWWPSRPLRHSPTVSIPAPRGSTRSTISAAAPSIFRCSISKGRVSGARHRRRRGTGRRRYRHGGGRAFRRRARQKSFGGAPPTPAEVKQALVTARFAKECLSSQIRGRMGDRAGRHHQPPCALDRATLERLAEPLRRAHHRDHQRRSWPMPGSSPPRSRAWCWSAVRPACRWCVAPWPACSAASRSPTSIPTRWWRSARRSQAEALTSRLGHAAARRDAAFARHRDHGRHRRNPDPAQYADPGRHGPGIHHLAGWPGRAC